MDQITVEEKALLDRRLADLRSAFIALASQHPDMQVRDFRPDDWDPPQEGFAVHIAEGERHAELRVTLTASTLHLTHCKGMGSLPPTYIRIGVEAPYTWNTLPFDAAEPFAASLAGYIREQLKMEKR